ncbi:MAG: hypothetical protein HY873_04295 [Chloroflexi bacterium]|nr:hypothetical protein [Chloroflexota bacterium]
MVAPIIHAEPQTVKMRSGTISHRFEGALITLGPLAEQLDDTSMPGYGLVASVDSGTGGTGIGVGILQTQADMPGYVTFYVAVDDLAASLARAETLGGKTIVPPTPIPNVGAFAMFEDPEGHMIGLLKQQP